MKPNKKDVLFLLVKSLSGAEKRQFSIYISRIQSNKNANFMQLFYLLEKMDGYDEKIILKKTQIKKPQIPNTKAHLYKQIMASLRSHPNHRDMRFEIRELLDFATILYNKGLYEQSLKTLRKSKKMALESQETSLMYQVLELEKIIESQYITPSTFQSIDLLSDQTKTVSNQIDLEGRFSNLSLQLYSWFLKFSYVKNEADLRHIKAYYQKKIPSIILKILISEAECFCIKRIYGWVLLHKILEYVINTPKN